jgi:hypothetical protein
LGLSRGFFDGGFVLYIGSFVNNCTTDESERLNRDFARRMARIRGQGKKE